MTNNLISIISYLLLLLHCSEASQAPNILYIFSDDHSINAISSYGSKINRTPNIDSIATEGVLFKNSFCTNSICQPSRAAILTGTHSHINGVTYNGAKWNGSQSIYPKILADRNYQTALIGKWHMHPNPSHEFQHWEVLSGHGGQGSYYNPLFENKNGSKREQGYSTDIITNKAITWLQKRNKEKPFLLKVQFKSPHVPRRPPLRYLTKYIDTIFPEPKSLHDNYQSRQPYAKKAWMQLYGMNLAGLNIFPSISSNEKWEPWQKEWFNRLTPTQKSSFHQAFDTRNQKFMDFKNSPAFHDRKKRVSMTYQYFIRDYIACIDAIDENVGKLLNFLKQHHLEENTIVIYSSDQSYFIGEHGWAEKRWMYEESLKMPFIIKWPAKLPKEKIIEAMIQNIDHAPSLLDMTASPIPSQMQGSSFYPLILDKATPWRDRIYYHYYHHGAHNVPRHDGIRNTDYKLIHFYTDHVYELYDLNKDPHELENLAQKPEYLNIRNKLIKDLKDLRKKYQVPEAHFEPPYLYPKKKK